MAVLFYKLLADIYSLFYFTANFNLTNPAINCMLKNSRILFGKGDIRFVGVNDKSKVGLNPPRWS